MIMPPSPRAAAANMLLPPCQPSQAEPSTHFSAGSLHKSHIYYACSDWSSEQETETETLAGVCAPWLRKCFFSWLDFYGCKVN